ncbi:hypothetical protein K8I28_00225 [bacterium]|nr:hypothetical protein [bacterium]
MNAKIINSILLLLTIVIGLSLRIYVINTAPVYNTEADVPWFNDETSHLNHVYFRMTRTGNPAQRHAVTEEYALERGEGEYSQPPLYYWVSAIILKSAILGFAKLDAVKILRWFSLILWFLAIWILWRFTYHKPFRELIIVFGMLLGAGFIPSATINNDALLAVCVAGLYAYISWLSRNKATILSFVNLGLIVAIGTWSKLSMLSLLPMAIACAYFYGGNQRSGQVKAGILVIFSFLWATLPLWFERISSYGTPLSLEAAAGSGGSDLWTIASYASHTLLCPWDSLWTEARIKVSLVLFIVLMVFTIIYLIQQRTLLFKNLVENEMLKIYYLYCIGGLFAIIAWVYYGIRFHQTDARLLLPAFPFLLLIIGSYYMLQSNKIRNFLLSVIIIIILTPLSVFFF